MPVTRNHVLADASIGSSRRLTSWHFGSPGSGTKAYIQASLHADELPGMLVAHHLRQRLAILESEGRLQGEVVLVPVSNPIGLSQGILHRPLGRFEALSGENFNRNHLQWFDRVRARVEPGLNADPAHNARIIRQALGAEIDALPEPTELASLRKCLIRLAHDADLVLDLHCDAEAVLHLYVQTPGWPRLQPLAQYLGAEAVLLNQQPGGHSFDEALGGPWWQLAEHFAGRHPIPIACVDTTVELRGQADVSHEHAASDAQAILDYLQHEGVVSGQAPAPPPLRCQATPLAGSENIVAPHAGLIVFARSPGDRLEKGDLVCEIIDPLADRVTPVRASVSGVLYARTHLRYATRGMDLADIAGSTPFRTGWLLSA